MQPSQVDPADPVAGGKATVTVLLFGRLREAAGWGRRSLDLGATGDPPTTPAVLWQRLNLGSIGVPCRVAVNQRFASHHTALRPGDEVAFLPPISGG